MLELRGAGRLSPDLEAGRGLWPKRYAESKYPHEREALEYLRENLPDSDPVLLYSSFKFIADDGSVSEVDALALRRGVRPRVVQTKGNRS